MEMDNGQMAETLRVRLRSLARMPDDPSAENEAEGLIGAFQQLRPDPLGLRELFEEFPRGEAVGERLVQVYSAATVGVRPDGARDAYFIPRRPPATDPDQVEAWGRAFFKQLARVARHLEQPALYEHLQADPAIRVLEGKPPKHPKAIEEKAGLLKSLLAMNEPMTRAWADRHAAVAMLQPAVYFMACDAFLRDYVLWPWIDVQDLEDPFAAYFQLWRHGVKYRIFQDEQIDLYMPREHETALTAS